MENIHSDTGTEQQAVRTKKPDLPHSVSALVLGIISLATLPLFGWIIAIIALVQSNKALKLHKRFPTRYCEPSLRMAKAGHIMGILGLVFGIIGTIAFVLYFMFIFYLALFFGNKMILTLAG